MICQNCGGHCTRYDEYRVCCRKCHQVWTLPEHADKPLPVLEAKAGQPAPVRLVRAPRVPAWVPGAVLGGLAVLVAVADWMF